MAGAEHPMQAHRVDSRAIQSRGQSADAREGVSSFLEKRRPVYPNKVSSDMPTFFPWWDEPPFEWSTEDRECPAALAAAKS